MDHGYDFSVDYASSFFQMKFFSGRLKMTLSYRGEWAFKGDSLVLTPDFNTADMIVDPSNLVPEENMQDSLDAWVNRYREQSIETIKEKADKGEKYTIKSPYGFFQGQNGMDRVRWCRALPETEKKVTGTLEYATARQ